MNLYDFIERKSTEFDPMFKDEKLKSMFKQAVNTLAPIYSVCTGSSGHHHNFRGGLLVHTFEMLDILKTNYFENLANTDKFNYSGKKKDIDFGLIATAIVFHDWGKIYEYDNSDPKPKDMKFKVQFTYTTHGHIFLSSEYIGKWCDTFEIDEKTKKDLQHMILSHHTLRAWGSPVAPQSPEAKILCACDLISAQYAALKSSYIIDYLDGKIDYSVAEQVYVEKVVPKMQAEYEKLDIIQYINNTNQWDLVKTLTGFNNNKQQ